MTTRKKVSNPNKPTEHLCSECGWRGIPERRNLEQISQQQLFDANLYARRGYSNPIYIGNQTWFLNSGDPKETYNMAKQWFPNGIPLCPKCPEITIPFDLSLILGRPKTFTSYFALHASPIAMTIIENLTGQENPAKSLIKDIYNQNVKNCIAKHFSDNMTEKDRTSLLEAFCRIINHGQYDQEVTLKQDMIIKYMIYELKTEWRELSIDALTRMEKTFSDGAVGKQIVIELFNREFGIR